ncbi:MAG: hypothetical protein IH784_06295 [Bacteroidetes bacterium]|nr:hypothetical protein [Bacteroidota bacterium]
MQWLMQIRVFILLLFIPLIKIEAQLSSFDYNGYAKYLFSSTRFPDTEKRYSDHLLHARLNTRWYPTEALTAALELRFRAFYGETIENTPNYIEFIKTPRDWVRLDVVLWDENKSIGYLEVDRLWFNWIKDDFEMTIGRQRIAWGTAWVWNPTDLFNPLNVLDFDYEELPAVDAVRVQYYTGAVTKVEAGYKPAKEKKNTILAGLWSINSFNYDFNIIGGMRDERWVFGGSWVGDIYSAGFRGEITVSEEPNSMFTNSLYEDLGEESLSSFDKPLVAIALSADYTFPNTFYIHTEMLYNNNGKTENTFLFFEEALSIGMLSPARWSVYQEFSYDITPLLRGSLFGIFNPDDGSYVIVPSVTYSIVTNLDLLLIAQVFEGDPLTEFGEFGSSFYFRLKFSY